MAVATVDLLRHSVSLHSGLASFVCACLILFPTFALSGKVSGDNRGDGRWQQFLSLVNGFRDGVRHSTSHVEPENISRLKRRRRRRRRKIIKEKKKKPNQKSHEDIDMFSVSGSLRKASTRVPDEPMRPCCHFPPSLLD